MGVEIVRGVPEVVVRVYADNRVKVTVGEGQGPCVGMYGDDLFFEAQVLEAIVVLRRFYSEVGGKDLDVQLPCQEYGGKALSATQVKDPHARFQGYLLQNFSCYPDAVGSHHVPHQEVPVEVRSFSESHCMYCTP